MVKRLNNSGFAISTMLYGLLIVMVLLLGLIMSTMSFTRNNSKKFTEQIKSDLESKIAIRKVFEGSAFDSTFKVLNSVDNKIYQQENYHIQFTFKIMGNNDIDDNMRYSGRIPRAKLILGGVEYILNDSKEIKRTNYIDGYTNYVVLADISTGVNMSNNGENKIIIPGGILKYTQGDAVYYNENNPITIGIDGVKISTSTASLIITSSGFNVSLNNDLSILTITAEIQKEGEVITPETFEGKYIFKYPYARSDGGFVTISSEYYGIEVNNTTSNDKYRVKFKLKNKSSTNSNLNTSFYSQCINLYFNLNMSKLVPSYIDFQIKGPYDKYINICGDKNTFRLVD